MTLRRRVSPVLPFGSRSVLTSSLRMVLDALTLRRRLLAVLLFSAAPVLMAQFSFRVGLCATGFSRFCSFSEQFYYGTFYMQFQSLNCSKNKIRKLSFRILFLLTDVTRFPIFRVSLSDSEGSL